MPNRILRPWLDSEAVNSLSDAAEVFFVRLIMAADDCGRFYGAPILLKSYLYPLKNKRVADIPRWIAECVNAGLIADYEVDGKRYLQIVNFGQQESHETSSFPSPEESLSLRGEKEGFSPTPLFSKKETEKRNTIAHAQKIFFDYEGDARIHGITQEHIDRWTELCPAIDVEAEINAATLWLDGNRKNRKSDIQRFLTNWLNRAQNRARTQTYNNRDTKDYTGL